MASFSAVSKASDPSQSEDIAADQQQVNAWIQQVNNQIAELFASRDQDRAQIQTQQAQNEDLQRRLNEATHEINQLRVVTSLFFISFISVFTSSESRHIRFVKQSDSTFFDEDISKYETFRNDLRMKLVFNDD